MMTMSISDCKKIVSIADVDIEVSDMQKLLDATATHIRDMLDSGENVNWKNFLSFCRNVKVARDYTPPPQKTKNGDIKPSVTKSKPDHYACTVKIMPAFKKHIEEQDVSDSDSSNIVTKSDGKRVYVKPKKTKSVTDGSGSDSEKKSKNSDDSESDVNFHLNIDEITETEKKATKPNSIMVPNSCAPYGK